MVMTGIIGDRHEIVAGGVLRTTPPAQPTERPGTSPGRCEQQQVLFVGGRRFGSSISGARKEPPHAYPQHANHNTLIAGSGFCADWRLGSPLPAFGLLRIIGRHSRGGAHCGSDQDIGNAPRHRAIITLLGKFGRSRPESLVAFRNFTFAPSRAARNVGSSFGLPLHSSGVLERTATGSKA
jgi:hypothetical protein